jgi:hypothetical protein
MSTLKKSLTLQPINCQIAVDAIAAKSWFPPWPSSAVIPTVTVPLEFTITPPPPPAQPAASFPAKPPNGGLEGSVSPPLSPFEMIDPFSFKRFLFFSAISFATILGNYFFDISTPVISSISAIISC